MSDLKPFQCLFGRCFQFGGSKKKDTPRSWVARTFRCFHPSQKKRRKIFRHKVWNFKGPQVARSTRGGQLQGLTGWTLLGKVEKFDVFCFRKLTKIYKGHFFMHNGALVSWPFVVLSLCHAGAWDRISWGLHSSWKGAATCSAKWAKAAWDTKKPQRPLGWSCLTCLTSYMELTVVKSIWYICVCNTCHI